MLPPSHRFLLPPGKESKMEDWREYCNQCGCQIYQLFKERVTLPYVKRHLVCVALFSAQSLSSQTLPVKYNYSKFTDLIKRKIAVSNPLTGFNDWRVIIEQYTTGYSRKTLNVWMDTREPQGNLVFNLPKSIPTTSPLSLFEVRDF